MNNCFARSRNVLPVVLTILLVSAVIALTPRLLVKEAAKGVTSVLERDLHADQYQLKFDGWYLSKTHYFRAGFRLSGVPELSHAQWRARPWGEVVFEK